MKSYSLIDVKEALRYGNEQERDIRMKLFSEARDKNKWEEIRTSPFYKEMVEEVVAQAEEFLPVPIKAIPYSKYRLFSDNGNRSEYQEYYYDRRARLNAFAFLSMLYGEKRYIGALEDTIWAICDEYTWCLPAHLPGGGNSVPGGTGGTDGGFGVTVDSREYKKILDLFCLETAFAISEITFFLKDKLSPLVVARATGEIKERVLDSYCMMNSTFDWETKTNNWAAVCGGSIGVAAMYQIEDYMVLAPIIYRALGAIESFMSGYGDDGICKEGLSYWNYGFGFFVCFSELLKQRTCGKIDLMDDEKVGRMALYQQRVILSGDKVVSFSDSKGVLKMAVGHTHHLKDRFDAVSVPDIKHREKFSHDTSKRWSRMIRNFMWSRSSYGGPSPEDYSCYFENSQWFISRVSRNDGIFCLAGKWGNNGEPHNHNDVGNFILHKKGETFISDLGASNYTRQNFREQRYLIFGNGSQGHSLPIIEGHNQKEGADRAAVVLEKLVSNDRDIFTADLKNLYEDENLKSLIRNFTFRKDDGIRLELKDSYSFRSKPSSIIERFITCYEPEEIERGKIRVGKGDNFILLVYSPDVLSFECGTHEHINHGGITEKVYSIDLYTLQLNEQVEINVEFILA